MPTTKDFKGPKKAKAAAKNVDVDDALDIEIDAAAAHPKRRPGRETNLGVHSMAASEDATSSTADDDGQQQFDLGQSGAKPEAETSSKKARSGSDEDLARLEREAEEPSDAPKIEITFKGSELLRSRIPSAFAIVEAVAADWVYGGEFDKLPINQPLAKFAAQQGLLKAKEVEKKVMESPRVEKAAMQILTAGMKAQGMVSQLRERLRR